MSIHDGKNVNVTINFQVKERDYEQYDGLVQDFICYLSALGIDTEIIEVEI